jgi:heme exporter protein A
VSSAPPLPGSANPRRLIEVRALACRRGERTLFSGLDLDLAAGELLWLRGGNGRGKTSLLRLLAGLSQAEAGRIERHAAFVYLAHHNALKEDLSAIESLAFLARLHGQAFERGALLPALKAVGLHSRRDAPVRTLSQGQRRRVALARLLLAPAKPLWLLDEPYDALDAEGCAWLDGVVAAHTRSGGAVLLTSHLPLAIQDPAPRELRLDEWAAAAAKGVA